MNVIIVTGSRVLAENPSTERWARKIIHEQLTREHFDLLIVGDASGPDAWAIDAAVQIGIHTNVYEAQSGNIVVPSKNEVVERWISKPLLAKIQPKSRPLLRNVAMVVTASRIAERAVICGTVALWSKTSGTLHTIGAASERGFIVRFFSAEKPA